MTKARIRNLKARKKNVSRRNDVIAMYKIYFVPILICNLHVCINVQSFHCIVILISISVLIS